MKSIFFKTYDIKISNVISIIYSKNKKILILVNSLKIRSLKIPFQICLLKSKNIIKISSLLFKESNKKKLVKSVLGTLFAIIKQFIIEILFMFYQKLKFIGIGYRVFSVNNFKNELLLFRLGFSHFLYFRISNNVKTFCLKTTKLFIYGNLYSTITQIASLIKLSKKINVYKGKGIFYNIEKIKLKHIKKL